MHHAQRSDTCGSLLNMTPCVLSEIETSALICRFLFMPDGNAKDKENENEKYCRAVYELSSVLDIRRTLARHTTVNRDKERH